MKKTYMFTLDDMSMHDVSLVEPQEVAEAKAMLQADGRRVWLIYFN